MVSWSGLLGKRHGVENDFSELMSEGECTEFTGSYDIGIQLDRRVETTGIRTMKSETLSTFILVYKKRGYLVT